MGKLHHESETWKRSFADKPASQLMLMLHHTRPKSIGGLLCEPDHLAANFP
jgi:hypothetical protein